MFNAQSAGMAISRQKKGQKVRARACLCVVSLSTLRENKGEFSSFCRPHLPPPSPSSSSSFFSSSSSSSSFSTSSSSSYFSSSSFLHLPTRTSVTTKVRRMLISPYGQQSYIGSRTMSSGVKASHTSTFTLKDVLRNMKSYFDRLIATSRKARIFFF